MQLSVSGMLCGFSEHEPSLVRGVSVILVSLSVLKRTLCLHKELNSEHEHSLKCGQSSSRSFTP